MFRQSRTAKVLALLIGVVSCAWSSQAVFADAGDLAHFLADPTHFIDCGDKRIGNFTGFSSTATGGAAVVGSDEIFVDCIMIGIEDGVRFSSDALDVTSGQRQRVEFEFEAFSTVGNLLKDNTLALIGGRTGSGHVDIRETVTDTNANTLAFKNVFLSPSGDQPIDQEDFLPGPVLLAHVRKVLFVSGGNNGTAFLSDFDQTFSQISPVVHSIPEPASVVLLGIGGVGALWFRRRRLLAS